MVPLLLPISSVPLIMISFPVSVTTELYLLAGAVMVADNKSYRALKDKAAIKPGAIM